MAADRKLEYLYASLSDLQSTIRAVDTKVSYLLVILFIPFTRLDAIYSKIKSLLLHDSKWLPVVAGILAFWFVVVWIIGFWCAFKSIIAIDDPKHHIDGDRPKSMFFPAHLFSHSFWNTIGFVKSTSMVQFKQHYDEIPAEPEVIAKHLTLEQMKTMYIASIKLKRSVMAYHFAILWVILGGTIWFMHLIFI